MQDFEAASVRETIERLVAEVGVENVPEDIDVDGALEILTKVIYGSEEEVSLSEVAGLEDALVAEAEADAPTVV